MFVNSICKNVQTSKKNQSYVFNIFLLINFENIFVNF